MRKVRDGEIEEDYTQYKKHKKPEDLKKVVSYLKEKITLKTKAGSNIDLEKNIDIYKA